MLYLAVFFIFKTYVQDNLKRLFIETSKMYETPKIPFKVQMKFIKYKRIIVDFEILTKKYTCGWSDKTSMQIDTDVQAVL